MQRFGHRARELQQQRWQQQRRLKVLLENEGTAPSSHKKSRDPKS